MVYVLMESYVYWIDEGIKNETLEAKRTGKKFSEVQEVKDRYQPNLKRFLRVMDKLLEVTDLKTGFDTERGLIRAVDGVTFEIDKGKRLEWWESQAVERRLQQCPSLTFTKTLWSDFGRQYSPQWQGVCWNRIR